jgi:YD repeat-containing protein
MKQPQQFRFVVFAIAALAAAATLSAVQGNEVEGALRASPVLRDASGGKIADGDFVQSVENDTLRVQMTYTGNGRKIEEIDVFRQRPELAQQRFQWRESLNGVEVRSFEVDFTTGMATALKTENGQPHRWSDQLHIEQGQTFAGFGFTLALKALHQRLVKGETVELKAVGFTPQPRMVTVALSFAGRESVGTGEGSKPAEHYVIHPKIPALAKWFVKAPDANVWLTPPPAIFVRFQGALVEPSDPIVRIDGG